MSYIAESAARHSNTEGNRKIIDEIIFQIRRIVQAREHHTKELNKKFKISTPQLNCLTVLYSEGPLPPSVIARQILVESSTVTGIIDRLEQKGFVRRVRDLQDRRKIFVELTESGKDLVQSAPPPVQEKIFTGLYRLPEDELVSILDGLTRLTRLLDS